MALPMTDVALCFMQAFWAIIVSTLIGLLGGGFTATIYFTLLNLYAQDGPYFSAVLIALVVVIPVAFMLLPFQVGVLVWRHFKGLPTVRGGLAVGAIGGVWSGLALPFVAFTSSQQRIGDVFSCLVIGLVQGCSTLVSLVCVLHCRQAARQSHPTRR